MTPDVVIRPKTFPQIEPTEIEVRPPDQEEDN